MSRSECQISVVPAGVTDDLSCLTLQPSQTSPSLMQEVESRKRPHLGDSDPLPSKKRAVSVNSTTILVNGDVHSTSPADEEPRDQDSLEQFRKEAIFRRMRHYSRENERSQARIAELERLKSTYEASLAVMGACWTQLVDTIRAHVKPGISPPLNDEDEGMPYAQFSVLPVFNPLKTYSASPSAYHQKIALPSPQRLRKRRDLRTNSSLRLYS
ncbi:hypothetical protein EDB84DRAFT_423172 [Lactarius hengduanensis]|nr:hypothetical protein EDB84DRAFT_423172 [Lactarius hengduanensis]